MSPQEFYQMLGGEIAQKALEYNWENACAARLSYAMNESGLKIPYIKGVTSKDINGRNYITLASDMKKYFNKIWGKGLYCKKGWTLKNGITFQNNLADVSGHVDVVYKGKSAAYATEYHKKMKTVETIIWKY